MTPHRRPVLNRCRARGHLAAVRIPIPADPSRFFFWADAEKTPCSALACSGCGLPVRSFPGLLVVGGAEARAALHAQGPEGVAGVTRGMSDYRLYVCPWRIGRTEPLFKGRPRSIPCETALLLRLTVR